MNLVLDPVRPVHLAGTQIQGNASWTAQSGKEIFDPRSVQISPLNLARPPAGRPPRGRPVYLWRSAAHPRPRSS